MVGFWRRALAAALCGAMALGGCGGPDHDSLCEQQVECIGGNDADRDACVATYEYMADVADDLGCDDEYDAYFECLEGSATCDTQDTQQPCSTDEECGGARCDGGTCKIKALVPEGDGGCQAEERAWSRCGDVDFQ